MPRDKDQIRLDVGRALNIVTASLASKSFETIQQDYKDVEKKYLAICDDSEFQLETRQRVSERVFCEAAVKNCAMDDLDCYYSAAADLGFSDINPRISLTIIYCQQLMKNDRGAEAKGLLEDLIDFLFEIEAANPGTFVSETFEFLQSLLSNCENEQN